MSNEETLTEETVTDFSEAPALPEAPEAQETQEPVANEGDEVTDADGEKSKGRPRDPNVAERDEKVLTAIAEGPITRDALAAKLDIPGNHVYLSLWRLRRADKIVKLNGKTWALPGTVLPEPAPKATEPAVEEAPAES